MANIDTFKAFVKKNPRLMAFVRNKEMTWQNFYEMFDLYGEDESVWGPYLKKEEVEQTTTAAGLDLLGFLKGIDLDAIQNGVSSIQRVLGVVQDLSDNQSKTDTKPEYKPRPLYKHFED